MHNVGPMQLLHWKGQEASVKVVMAMRCFQHQAHQGQLQWTLINLVQSLAVDLRPATVDHKTSRLDLKKSISSIFGTPTEDSTSIPSLGRNLPNAIEEIRRMSTLNDNSNKARERSRAFGGAIAKIDKLYPNVVRKRSRGDSSSNERSSVLSSGGVSPKNVPQSYLNADDMEPGLQREERTKNA